MKKTEFIYEAQLDRVVDGDTVVLLVDLGFETYILKHFRLLGVDTPEVYGVKKGSEEYKRGKLASNFTEQWFEDNGNEVVIQSYDAQKKLKTGKYGRWIAMVYPRNSNPALNEALLFEGLAEPDE